MAYNPFISAADYKADFSQARLIVVATAALLLLLQRCSHMHACSGCSCTLATGADLAAGIPQVTL